MRKKFLEVKKGDKRISRKGVMWEVVSLRPFKVRVYTASQDGSWGSPYVVESSRKEFLAFGEPYID